MEFMTRIYRMSIWIGFLLSQFCLGIHPRQVGLGILPWPLGQLSKNKNRFDDSIVVDVDQIG